MLIEEHLRERGLDLSKIKPLLGEGVATFLLWNLSGQVVGYQHYNPLGTKAFNQKKADRSLMKYFTYVSGHKETNDKKIGVWGLETYNVKVKRIFITEGVFDAAPFHLLGECALATLSNDPHKSVCQWIKGLPQEKIVISDNDGAGTKLEKLGDRSVKVSAYKDVGELWESGNFLEWFKNNF